MKRILFLTTCFQLLLFTQTLFSQSVTSVCSVLKPINDFTSDQNPSLKKLKKMMGNTSNDEVIDYAIYLHDFLVPKNIKYYDDFERASTGESYPNQKSIEANQMTIAKEYILPMASTGNVRVIAFLCNKGYLKKTQALEYITQNKNNSSAMKFMAWQLNLEITGVVSNLYTEDIMLDDYFSDFKKVDLLRIRGLINAKITEIDQINKDFNFSEYDYKNNKVKESVLKKLPSKIDDPNFCLSFTAAPDGFSGMLKIYPESFYDKPIRYDAIKFLQKLRASIDLILMEENSESLAQILFDYKNGRMQNKWDFNFTNPADQFFKDDEKWNSTIFKLLSSALPCDSSNLKRKSYYLNCAAQSGASDAYFNLACLFQTLYYQTNFTKYNDSCIYYLEKLIPINYPAAYMLKGIKIFNGEGYLQNKEEGIKLIQKAKSLGSSSATNLLETLPQKWLASSFEGFYFKNYVEIKYPWDFKVQCSNKCGKYTYPKSIIFGRKYDNNSGLPQITKADFFLDDLGNPTINISENDFRSTFTIAELGFKYFKHVMCSKTCQLEHEHKNDKNWNAMKAQRVQFDEEIVKCSSCTKTLKRKDMLSVNDCPCIDNSGSTIYLDFNQSGDIFGDTSPKVCSAKCQIDFCKIQCGKKGYTSKY